MSFPFTKQPDSMDCGPACLGMIAVSGDEIDLERLRYAARVANIAGYIEVELRGIKLITD
jgi:ABC-type bacteriocin/lantibiotic exporter with double-glycine peptidase domain